MTNENLNNLVRNHNENPTDETFRKIYEAVAPMWKPKAHTIAKSMKVDAHDVTEVYEETLMRCVEKYDGAGSFEHFFRTCAKRARIDLSRKVGSRLRHERTEADYTANTDDGEETNEFERLISLSLADEQLTPEEHATQTKEADQWQLIDFLTQNCDATTMAVVEAALGYRPDDSVGRPKSVAGHVADVLGIDKRTVKRKLESLASNFDSTKLGNYTDYLCAQI